MPKILERSIQELRARVGLDEVVRRAGVVLRKNGADDFVGLCPWHDERTGSFHVHPAKGFFKCFGCGKGGSGAVSFVMAREGIQFVDAVKKIADDFGIVLEYEAPRHAESARESGADEVPAGNVIAIPSGIDPKAARRAIQRQARYERQRNAEAAADEAWLETWRSRIEARRLEAWSDVVRDRWEFGSASQTVQAMAEKLAADRGWPLQWVLWCIDEGLLAWPVVPWSDSDRSVAWRVDRPVLAGPVLAGVEAVGYHQRVIFKDSKSWVYVPYMPDREKQQTEFQRKMVEAEIARGAIEGDGRVPGLPFVMGATSPCRLLVITEGQWDAVSFAGASGWLSGDSSWPQGVTVMGARGNQGVDVLLAYWGAWIERERPVVLVLADNDAAGARWDTPEPMDADIPGSPLKPTFCERLLKRPDWTGREGVDGWVPMARDVKIVRVPASIGKDFNDYWKARKPSVEGMARWLRGLGLY